MAPIHPVWGHLVIFVWAGRRPLQSFMVVRMYVCISSESETDVRIIRASIKT